MNPPSPRQTPPPAAWPVSDEATISGSLTLRTGNLCQDSSVGSPEEGGSGRKRKDSTFHIPSNSNNKRRKTEQMSKTLDPHKDYIHVRARRGQATDSHNLAERISGKALVLDEIINYIQSLKHQVEFLSMKLEEVNSRMMIDAAEDLQLFDATAMFFIQREYAEGPRPEWLHMQMISETLPVNPHHKDYQESI